MVCAQFHFLSSVHVWCIYLSKIAFSSNIYIYFDVRLAAARSRPSVRTSANFCVFCCVSQFNWVGTTHARMHTWNTLAYTRTHVAIFSDRKCDNTRSNQPTTTVQYEHNKHPQARPKLTLRVRFVCRIRHTCVFGYFNLNCHIVRTLPPSSYAGAGFVRVRAGAP